MTATTKIDLSAAAISLKKSVELEAIRNSKRQRDSVRNIIKSMDERGIGSVKLDGVEVDAFVRQMQKEECIPQGEAVYDMAAAILAANAGNDSHGWEVTTNVVPTKKGDSPLTTYKKKVSEGSTAGIGSGGSPSKSLENYLEQAFETYHHGPDGEEGQWTGGGTGGGPTGPGMNAGEGAVNNKYNRKNTREEDEKLRNSIIKQADEAIAATAQLLEDAGGEAAVLAQKSGKGRGVYKEHVPKKKEASAGNQQQSSYAGIRSANVDAETHDTSDMIKLYSQNDGADRGVDVNALNEHAYKMNASKNVPRNKLENAGMGYGGELHPQKDLEECVDQMAKMEHNQQPGVKEEFNIPEKDAAEAEYEQRLVAAQEERKAKAEPAVYIPKDSEGESKFAADSPDQYQQRLRTNKSAGASSATAAEDDDVEPHQWEVRQYDEEGDGIDTNKSNEEGEETATGEEAQTDGEEDGNAEEGTAAIDQNLDGGDEEAAILAELGCLPDADNDKADAKVEEGMNEDNEATAEVGSENAATDQEEDTEAPVNEAEPEKVEEEAPAVKAVEPEPKVEAKKKVVEQHPMAAAKELEAEMQEQAKKGCGCVIS